MSCLHFDFILLFIFVVRISFILLLFCESGIILRGKNFFYRDASLAICSVSPLAIRWGQLRIPKIERNGWNMVSRSIPFSLPSLAFFLGLPQLKGTCQDMVPRSLPFPLPSLAFLANRWIRPSERPICVIFNQLRELGCCSFSKLPEHRSSWKADFFTPRQILPHMRSLIGNSGTPRIAKSNDATTYY